MNIRKQIREAERRIGPYVRRASAQIGRQAVEAAEAAGRGDIEAALDILRATAEASRAALLAVERYAAERRALDSALKAVAIDGTPEGVYVEQVRALLEARARGAEDSYPDHEALPTLLGIIDGLTGRKFPDPEPSKG